MERCISAVVYKVGICASGEEICSFRMISRKRGPCQQILSSKIGHPLSCWFFLSTISPPRPVIVGSRRQKLSFRCRHSVRHEPSCSISFDSTSTCKKKESFLFYFILFYFILFYFILFYFILFYFILFYFILFYFILFYF